MKSTKTTKPPNFMKYKSIYFAVSLFVIIPGFISLLRFGLRPSIDFTGGSLMEIAFKEEGLPTESQITASASGLIEISSIQTIDKGYLIRTKPLDKQSHNTFKLNIASLSASLIATSSAHPLSVIDESRFETVGPTLGQELIKKTIYSVILAATAILFYIAYRFNEIKYGVCGILAMFHDTLILVGTFSLLGHFYHVEVDTLFVTAVLTTLSFSVHDTIVVYDRIRESIKQNPKAPFAAIVNKSVAETLSRSINNSMTIIFMLLALWLMGGDSTKWFVFALLVGTIAGTYSSTFTAAPLLIVWENLRKKSKSN